MLDGLLWAYIIVVGAAILWSAALTLQTWEHRRYARASMRCVNRRVQPPGHVTLIAPCKGLDVELADNLAQLMRQDHTDYEVRFVVESARDPACEVIRQVMADHPHVPSMLIVAGAARFSGQKVHNLRVATADLSPDTQYVAFVDSDAAPRPEWLRLLVARLNRPEIGATTGYRWFMPARPTLPNLLVYSVNCGVMVLLGRWSHYLVWGGSWAIRRDLFDTLGIRDAWHGTLSDDLVASRMLWDGNVGTRFEPGAVVASPLDVDWHEAFSFMRRQYLVSRYYAPLWWLLGMLGSTFSGFARLIAATGILAGLFGWLAPAIVLPMAAALYATGVARGLLRQSLVKTYFPDRQQELAGPRWFDILLGPFVGLANWAGMLASGIGRHITWRGRRYRLTFAGRVTYTNPPAEVDLAMPVTLHENVPQAEPRRRSAAA